MPSAMTPRQPANSTVSDQSSDYRGRYLGVLVLALIVRLLWAVLVPVVLESDCKLYDIFARNLALGNGFSWEAGRPTVFVPVGAPFLFSLCYRLFGFYFTPIVILNVVLGVGSVAFTMGLAGRWFGSLAGFWAGLIMALWPSQVEFVTTMATEPSFLFFMLAGWYFYHEDESPWLLRSILSGLLFAAASYIRPLALVIPVILSGSTMIGRRQFVRPFSQAALALMIMAACLAPWAIRNKRTFGEYTLSAHAKLNMWMGNNPESDGGYTPPPLSTSQMTELEREHYLGTIAYAYIREHPARFVGRSLVKFVRLHERESIGVTWNITGLGKVLPPRAILGLKIFNNLYWWTALTLGIGGLVTLVRACGILPALIHPAVLVWGYFAVTHAIIVIQDRYHFPSIPSIAALGAYFLVARFPRFASRIALSRPVT